MTARAYVVMAAWILCSEWEWTIVWVHDRAWTLWWAARTAQLNERVMAALEARQDINEWIRWDALYQQAHQQWRAEIEVRFSEKIWSA